MELNRLGTMRDEKDFTLLFRNSSSYAILNFGGIGFYSPFILNFVSDENFLLGTGLDTKPMCLVDQSFSYLVTSVFAYVYIRRSIGDLVNCQPFSFSKK